MIVFHSSPCIVNHPDVSFSRDYLGFGKGFYVTTIEDQARKYAKRFLLRGNQMIDASKQIVLQAKYARIISLIASKSNITLDQAMEQFYSSEVFLLIQDGVADLHCRSDQYLADEVCREKLKQ